MMGEDDPRLKPEPGSENYAETLLYDYAKFLTALALLALGGVLSLSQSDRLDGVEPFNLGLAIASISVGGICAFSVAHGIVSARAAGKEPSQWPRRYMTVAIAGIAIGLGAFLHIFWKALT